MFYDRSYNKEYLTKIRTRFYLIGAIFCLLGLASLTMPLLASYAIETLIGCLFLAVAMSAFFGAVKGIVDGDNPIQEIIIAFAGFLVAFIFLAKPMAGMLTVSMLLFAYFVVDGFVRFTGFLRLRKIRNSGWLLLSSVLSWGLAWFMWSSKAMSLAIVGTVLGVNLLFGGISLILMGIGCSKILRLF